VSDLIVNWTQLDPNRCKAMRKVAKKIGMRFIPDAGWHVSIMYDGDYHIFLINPFVTRNDAERAMAALEKAGIDTAHAAIKAGRKRCIEVAMEALAW